MTEEEHRGNTENPFTRLEGKIDRISEILLGDGRNPGFYTRMDRLERLEEDRKMHRGILYTSVIGLIIERTWHWFTGK